MRHITSIWNVSHYYVSRRDHSSGELTGRGGDVMEPWTWCPEGLHICDAAKGVHVCTGQCQSLGPGELSRPHLLPQADGSSRQIISPEPRSVVPIEPFKGSASQKGQESLLRRTQENMPLRMLYEADARTGSSPAPKGATLQTAQYENTKLPTPSLPMGSRSLLFYPLDGYLPSHF